MEPTTDLPTIEDIERSVVYALGWDPDPDTYFPLCFSESHPYKVPAVRPKAKPKKQHNIKRRNKRK